ncbi:ATP-binding cassette domain-containing protein [Corynebacterium sp. sy017]|uniref:ATP-binding cassette domain-containing protein n=1 Tax=unclassified Corynebacterium TaxID=2624378 RepID=UPI00118716A5|nr:MULTISPECIES: ATP-binding cassette domain-containing protein [unclassified Corynebacterium]MBP3089112.1 ATP-binding cassette domain-containing protein [Corynebacterium sp. sy017]QDZ42471.1 ATP-binding cassette domain-containing protein [Corynebacterium sp. sy039]TSD91426.1 ATP-binding cassette domain-containing protein [Corynebacterium sp. SY003]
MITVQNLSKRYGRQQVLNNLSFSIPDGQVTGFLGPNGAGKSTTMRCILGLDRPSAGSVNFSGAYLNGQPYSGSFSSLKHKSNVAGAVLDAAWFHPKRSGKGHLKVLADSAGVPRTRVDECLEIVGLSSAAKRAAGGYSLGMKQRLSLAAALLGNPQHLIMDEPVNGLDPEGVTWMRNIIRHLASEGRSLLVSSHLLSEMQMTADRLVVIARGEMVGEYSMDEFLSGGTYVSVTTESPAEKLIEILRGYGYTSSIDSAGKIRISAEDSQQFDEAQLRYLIAQIAVEHRLLITELITKTENLEQRFLAATSAKQEYKMGATQNV